MDRDPIRQQLVTGVRVVDAMLPCCKGQRIGLFGGSGVGKSTLLAAMARSSKAAVNVIAMIGERNREVR
jgi:flagellum-specific ATP synthase